MTTIRAAGVAMLSTLAGCSCNGDDTGEAPDAVVRDAAIEICPVATRWSRAFGGSADDAAAAIATDGSGRVAVAGWLNGSADPGAGPSVSAGAEDIFVAMYAGDGTPAWNVRFGGANRDQAFALALTPDGDVVIAGRFEGQLDVGATTLTSNGLFDAFVAKLDGSTGAPIWARSFGNVDQDEARGVAVSDSGAIGVTGHFARDVSFGNIDLSSHASPPVPWSDVFVVRLDGDGDAVWARRAGGASFDEGEAITFAPDGDLVVVGRVYPNDVDFDGVPFVGHGDGTLGSPRYDAFVARFAAADGALAWVTELGGDQTDEARAVAIDSSTGDILVGGTLGASHAGDVEGFVAPSQIFIARVTADGVVAAMPLVSPMGTDAALKALVPDGAGGTWIAGGFDNLFELGGSIGTLQSVEPWLNTDTRRRYDAFILHLDAAGVATEAIQLGGYESDQLRALALGPEGGVVAAGELGYQVDACTGSLTTTSGGSDAWILSIDPGAGTTAAADPIDRPPPFTPPTGTTTCVPPELPGLPPPATAAPTFAVDDWGAGPIPSIDNDFAVGDIDGDGDEDLVAVAPLEAAQPGLVIYRNDGTGHFAEDTSAAIAPGAVQVDGPSAIRLFDADADGSVDLFAAGAAHDRYPFPAVQPRFYRQSTGLLRDETYATLPVFGGAGGILVGDLDCDGLPDLWPQRTATELVLMNDGDGAFRFEPRIVASTHIGGEAAVSCDVDRDGAPDLIWFGNTPGSAYDFYFHNDGLGMLTQELGTLPMRPYYPDPLGSTPRAECVDYDLDGWPDLVLLGILYDGTGASKISLWHNRGDGTFENRSVDAPPIGPTADLRVVDLNGDSWPDLIASRQVNSAQAAQVFINDGTSHFDEIPGFAPFELGTTVLVPIHADADAKMDLLQLRLGTVTPSSVLRNTSP